MTAIEEIARALGSEVAETQRQGKSLLLARLKAGDEKVAAWFLCDKEQLVWPHFRQEQIIVTLNFCALYTPAAFIKNAQPLTKRVPEPLEGYLLVALNQLNDRPLDEKLALLAHLDDGDLKTRITASLHADQ